MGQKVKYEADLHCHTTASDGLLTPEEVVQLASKVGLKALGITDHDTIEGWSEAEKAAAGVGIRIIKGIEINTEWEQKEVHILGYGMEAKLSNLSIQIHEIQKKRIVRIEEILEKLKVLGMEITFDEVTEYVHGESVGRPHVAQAIVKRGFAATIQEAFENFLKIGTPAYVPRYKLNPTQAIGIIRDAGGIAVLAHPGVQIKEAEIDIWVKNGLQGIEVNHPDHSLEDCRKYKMVAERMGLVATGGSDFHGCGMNAKSRLGDWGVSMEIVEKIESMLDLRVRTKNE